MTREALQGQLRRGKQVSHECRTASRQGANKKCGADDSTGLASVGIVMKGRNGAIQVTQYLGGEGTKWHKMRG